MEHTTSKRGGGAAFLSDAASPAQLRIDLWNRLREQVARVADDLRGAPAGDIELLLDRLGELERLWAYPGTERVARLRELHRSGDRAQLRAAADEIADRLGAMGDRAAIVDLEEPPAGQRPPAYFTVLLVDGGAPEQLRALHRDLRELRAHGKGDLIYEVVRVGSFEEAWLAVMCNTDIQAVVMRRTFPIHASAEHPITAPGIRSELNRITAPVTGSGSSAPVCDALAGALRHLRPELDLYLLTNESLADASAQTAQLFSRVFYRFEAAHELHMTVLDGVRARATAPFFDALRAYADRPIGNFHALPIARGHSVFSSRWIQDFGRFYGDNLFMAESSSTAGGLDSLLEPTGTIKEAQDLAARCFGAQRTFFVTNGTSTANKIVHMALVRPGDIVLIDRNCHKSHHYGLALAGARPLYLDAYPLQPFAGYGGVSLRTLKQKLLELKRIGQLHRVRLVVLTNVTFDGIVYNPERVMEELLAIHPTLCFLWDEAWFAYARFLPLMRRRTAMAAAQALGDKLGSRAHRDAYRAFRSTLGPGGLDGLSDEDIVERRLVPDPDRTQVRVYATQSTHKSLSAFRQASMIHVWDQQFERSAAEPFTEAFLAHTSTSPNHQLVASLDVARKQMQLEGFAMVKTAYQLALRMRDRVATDPLIARYLSILEPEQMIPASFRRSGFDRYAQTRALDALESAFADDEFVLDPTRLTVYTALTGTSGFEFRQVLMKDLGVQVNHTSINTVLMNATIGVTWGALSFLLDGLRRYAVTLDRRLAQAAPEERRRFDSKIRAITAELPPLPDFSGFHAAFRTSDVGEGDLRAAFFLAFTDGATDHVPLSAAAEAARAGRPLVSTRFVVPYPPGFPILVPGQIVSAPIIEFMRKLDVHEVHGYRPELGLAVFSRDALERRGARERDGAELPRRFEVDDARRGLH